MAGVGEGPPGPEIVGLEKEKDEGSQSRKSGGEDIGG